MRTTRRCAGRTWGAPCNVEHECRTLVVRSESANARRSFTRANLISLLSDGLSDRASGCESGSAICRVWWTLPQHPVRPEDQAQRERLAKLTSWSLLKTCAVATAEISKNPSTNFGNFLQRNEALLPTSLVPSLRAQWTAYPRTTKPIMALRAVLARTATFPAASE